MFLRFQTGQDSSAAAGIASPFPGYRPGGLFTASASFQRPADAVAYAAGDRVADSVSAASVLEFTTIARPAGEAVRIERARLRKTSSSLSNASFRVHLFRSPPSVSADDNGVFNVSGALAIADIVGHVDFFDITMNAAAAIGAFGEGVPSKGSGATFSPAGSAGHESSCWAVVEALSAYTPAISETFVITLEGARA